MALTNAAKKSKVKEINTQKSTKEKFKNKIQKNKNGRIFADSFLAQQKIQIENKEKIYVMYGKLSHLIPTH